MSQIIDLRKAGIGILEVVNLYVKLAVQDAARQKTPTTVTFDGRDLLRIVPRTDGNFEIEFLDLGREIQGRLHKTMFQCAGRA